MAPKGLLSATPIWAEVLATRKGAQALQEAHRLFEEVEGVQAGGVLAALQPVRGGLDVQELLGPGRATRMRGRPEKQCRIHGCLKCFK